MDEQRPRQSERRLAMMLPHDSEGRIHYLLKEEDKILRSISARAPLSEILNEICTALDCQIGNMVSLISLPEGGRPNTADIARHAALFGLHIFFSAGLINAGGEELGSLEMYCCPARDASNNELQLIGRAICLAAIAMERDRKAGHQANQRRPQRGPARGNALSWPVSMN
jgi:hypothetical protein